MNIRRAEKRDAKRLTELLLEVCHLHAEGRPDIFKDGARKYSDGELYKIIENDEAPIFVAADENDYVLGYAFCIYKITENSIFMQDSRMLYIDDLCVDSRYRGRQIGTELFEFVKDFAKKEGFDTVTLNVWYFNEAAVKFYEKCGFAPLKTVMEMKI